MPHGIADLFRPDEDRFCWIKADPTFEGLRPILYEPGDRVHIGPTPPIYHDEARVIGSLKSIYKLLTAYFRTAKTRRQIILITHNPNLVVNGDSEQVIVANCARRANGLPSITYKSGSLENDIAPDAGIKQQVCRILEGSSDAFRRRERRYALRDE